MKLVVVFFVLTLLSGCAHRTIEITRSPASTSETERESPNFESYSRGKNSRFPAAPPPSPIPSPVQNSINPVSKVNITNYKVPTIEQATDQIIQQLFISSAAIVTKNETRIDQSFPLTLVIDPTKNKEQLEIDLRVENSNQQVEVTETKTSSLAWPNLIAPDFVVEPVIAAEQPITKDSETSWTWQLKPKAEGTFSIIVELYAVVYVGDQKTRKKYKTLTHNITVTVPPVSKTTQVWNWIDSKWDWLWSVLIIPLVGYLWSKFKKKKSK